MLVCAVAVSGVLCIVYCVLRIVHCSQRKSRPHGHQECACARARSLSLILSLSLSPSRATANRLDTDKKRCVRASARTRVPCCERGVVGENERAPERRIEGERRAAGERELREREALKERACASAHIFVFG